MERDKKRRRKKIEDKTTTEQKKDVIDADGIIALLNKKKNRDKKVTQEKYRLKWRKALIQKGANSSDVDRILGTLLFKSVLKDSQSIVKDLSTYKSLPGQVRYDEDLDLEYYSHPSQPRDDLIYKDNLFPEPLRKLLNSQLDLLAQSEFNLSPQLPSSESNPQKVFNLVDPCLYPFISNVSYHNFSTPTPNNRSNPLPDSLASDSENTLSDEAITISSKYQQLPSDFSIVDFGTKINIDSYINGLDQKKYKELYHTLSLLFLCFVPLLQKLLGKDFINPSKSEACTLQVITKVTYYTLEPGEVYNSSWHIEGMPHEHILASAIYYPFVDTVFNDDASLFFRAPLLRSARMDEPNHRKIGFVETPQGRGIVWDNTKLQHKVKNIINIGDKDKPNEKRKGVRKIVVFWVVDKNTKIAGSREVPNQRWDEMKVKIGVILGQVNKRMEEEGRRILPVEMLVEIMKWVKWGFGRKEAEEHRQKMLDERKYYVDANNKKWERVVEYATSEDSG